MLKRPAVGVAVLVRRGDRILLGKRRSTSHGDGLWQCPGGHLEWHESVTDCALRETLEETGLGIVVDAHGPFTNDIFVENDRHFVTLFVLAHADHGEPVAMEPDKCDGWQWFSWDALPAPLFPSLVHLRASGFVPPPHTR